MSTLKHASLYLTPSSGDDRLAEGSILMIFAGDEDYGDDITSAMIEDEEPTALCGICGTTHTAPACQWNTDEEDSDVAF